MSTSRPWRAMPPAMLFLERRQHHLVVSGTRELLAKGPMLSVSDGVSPAWRGASHFQGKVLKSLFLPLRPHSSPTLSLPIPSPPSSVASTLPLVLSRGGSPTSEDRLPPPPEGSREPPSATRYFPTSPCSRSADPPRVSPGNHHRLQLHPAPFTR
ncbi:hypothetical protein T440DRAFT_136378 [Plenodomus tracheiphilus IPT5]|uniref:Uncharacterized protein n=1 Tax=Plenodomus tracheiphilus IPT5 TaxID=1408161 RepID=A0A6A7B1N6_9PLEO|nr:hypothetical protein T440DRAFT_136378 [Plenodomus tracheiphilus IPT5]